MEGAVGSRIRPARLTFKTTIDRRYTPAQKRGRPYTSISLGNSPPGMFGDVTAIPDWTKAFIKINGKRRKLMENCINEFRFDENYQHTDAELKR